MKNDKEFGINRLLCKFENPRIESDYRLSEWTKYSPYIPIMLVLASISPIINLLAGIINKSYSDFSSSIFFILLGIIILLQKDDFRKKYIPWIIFVFFILIFPVNLLINFQSTHHKISILPLYPIITSLIILRLSPITFLMALSASLSSFIAALYIQDVTYITPISYIFFFVPYLILVFDKWRSDIIARREYAQNEIIKSNRKLMHETLKKYFGEHLSEKILSQKGNLQGEIKWVTILFTDISSYSTIIEHMSPEVAVKILNQYFSSMHDIIEKYNGYILNYIGDALMVSFGAPKSLENHEVKAVECALEMREQLKILNENWDNDETSRFWKNHKIKYVTNRTGVHTGSIIAGNIGSNRMLQYSAIGDVVNIASRLEQVNKEFDTSISISEEIYNSLTKELHESVKLSGEIKLKGRSSLSKVYSI